MKTKLTYLFLPLLICSMLMGCGKDDVDSPEPENPDIENPETPEPPKPAFALDTVLKSSAVRTRLVASTENFTNPERGFHHQHSHKNTTTAPLAQSQYNNLKEDGVSLILDVYYMNNYKATLLDKAMLDCIRGDMQNNRDNGFKSVLRFAYEGTQFPADNVFDAPFELACQHLRQLTPILKEYCDVIFVMEMGFIGAWGEGYYTTNYPQQAWSFATPMRSQLADSILQALPTERMLCVRYAEARIRMLDTWDVTQTPAKVVDPKITYRDTLARANAFNGSKAARLAFHNDCFMAGSTDMSTYTSQEQRDFIHHESRYLHNGGETCQPSAGTWGPENYTCDKSLPRFEEYHFSHLNRSYYSGILNAWRDQGCMDEIKRRMGYRFETVYVDAPKTITKGSSNEFTFLIKNVGFASCINPRPVKLLLVKNGTVVSETDLSSKVDPRFWFVEDNKRHHLFTGAINVPSDASGEHTVVLWFPDPKPTIASRPAYAIRLANDAVWNSEKGYNEMLTLSL